MGIWTPGLISSDNSLRVMAFRNGATDELLPVRAGTFLDGGIGLARRRDASDVW